MQASMEDWTEDETCSYCVVCGNIATRYFNGGTNIPICSMRCEDALINEINAELTLAAAEAATT